MFGIGFSGWGAVSTCPVDDKQPSITISSSYHVPSNCDSVLAVEGFWLASDGQCKSQ